MTYTPAGYVNPLTQSSSLVPWESRDTYCVFYSY